MVLWVKRGTSQGGSLRIYEVATRIEKDAALIYGYSHGGPFILI
jgi:hypothetical protein